MSNTVPQIPSARPGALVRIVTNLGTKDAPRALYAHILSVEPISPEVVGEHGEPTIGVAFMDQPTAAALAKVDWHSQFQRVVGVRHVSHEDVKRGMVSVAWVDVLPDADEDDVRPEIDALMHLPEPIKPSAVEVIPGAPGGSQPPSTPAEQAAATQPPPKAPATSYKLDFLPEGTKVSPSDAAIVEGNGLVAFSALAVGDVLDKPVHRKVTGIEPMNEDGVVVITTEGLSPSSMKTPAETPGEGDEAGKGKPDPQGGAQENQNQQQNENENKQ